MIIEVTQDDIDKSYLATCSDSMVALAIMRMTGKPCIANGKDAHIAGLGRIELPDTAVAAIDLWFDGLVFKQGNFSHQSPFSFELPIEETP